MDTVQEELTKVINGVDVKKLHATIDAINNDPDLASFSFHAVNEWVDGAQSKTVVDHLEGGPHTIQRGEPFVLRSDQPEVLLGSDTAPNPIVELLHSLASSLSVSIVYHAAAREIQIDRLTIQLDGDIDLHGFLGLSSEVRPGFQDVRVTVDLQSEAPRADVEELLRYAQKVSPIVDTLRNRIPVEITLK